MLFPALAARHLELLKQFMALRVAQWWQVGGTIWGTVTWLGFHRAAYFQQLQLLLTQRKLTKHPFHPCSPLLERADFHSALQVQRLRRSALGAVCKLAGGPNVARRSERAIFISHGKGEIYVIAILLEPRSDGYSS